VASISSEICKPAASILLIAVSFPWPVPFTCTFTVVIPNALALLATTVAACPAEYGVDFFEPL
jgi:hypothetical protein